MKKLLNEWRNYSEYYELFERHEYIEHVLGIKPLLNESGGLYYSSEIRMLIIEEQLLLEGFLDRFNVKQTIKQYGEDIGSLFTTLYSVIRNPSLIPAYVKAAEQKVLKTWKQKIEKVQKFLVSKNMPTFAQGLEKAVNVIKSVMNMPANWKKAIGVTGVIIGIAYLFQKLEEKGADIFGGSPSDQLSDQVLKAAEKFLMKEFPAMMAKLYGKAAFAASTGFVGFVAAAASVVSVINLAKNALKPLFANFKLRKQRQKSREASAARGDVERTADGKIKYDKAIGNRDKD